MNIYIFGAHARAKTLWIYLHELYPDFVLKGYLVNNDEINPDNIDNVPVVHLNGEEGTEFDIEGTVYLGIRGVGHKVATTVLEGIGFKKIIPVTPDLDMQLRNRFLERYYSARNMIFNKIDDGGRDCNIYVIRSAFDKPLESCYTAQKNEVELQVGASLTDIKLTSLVNSQSEMLYDNTGENISNKNRQFSELTGIYWAWKNRCYNDKSIIGFEHYRRHFLLPDDWQMQMIEKGIDVILPTPIYVYPSVKENYWQRHVGEVLDYALFLFDEKGRKGNSKYNVKKFEDFLLKPLYAPCNMFITRVEIFKELCEWLFPILFAVEDRFGMINDRYQNRYPGFVAERLISFYFMQEDSRYNVAFVDKNFLF